MLELVEQAKSSISPFLAEGGVGMHKAITIRNNTNVILANIPDTLERLGFS